MIDLPYLADIVQPTPSRILLVVVDGLGGLPHPETGRSELETARLPNLDRLAGESACGLLTPVLPGIAPGSAPGHLALFGYDPLKYYIGRGVLEALGVGLEVREGDVTARGNFCTLDDRGLVVDRRAGRIGSEEASALCQRLAGIRLPGVEVVVRPVREHRFVLLLRGPGLSEAVSDTDPEKTGLPPLDPRPLSPEGERTAYLLRTFVEEARKALADQPRANMVLLRGLSRLPRLPSFAEAYRVRPLAVAAYPMYRGLARLVGMEVVPTGPTFRDEVDALREHFPAYQFAYLHYKPADTAGEDGDFPGKVRALEDLDSFIPTLLDLRPDVFILTGDHSTPALLGGHSWHPVPVLLHSPWTRGEGVPAFTERACAGGSLGRLPAVNLMLLALAHAGKLTKYGP